MSTSAPPPFAPPPRPRNPGLGLVPGLVVVALGVGFLLDNLGLLHFQADCLLPLILIFIGAVKMTRQGTDNIVWGGLIAAVGAGWMLDCFRVLPFAIWRLWPVFLIVLGVLWLWGAAVRPGPPEPGSGTGSPPFGNWEDRYARRLAWRARRAAWRAQRHGWPTWQPGAAPGGAQTPWWAAAPATGAAPPSDAGASAASPAGGTAAATLAPETWVQMSAVFTGLKRRVHSREFLGASLFAFFGGCDLDLRPIASTDHVIVIDAHAIFGGIEIYVPNDWLVSVQGTGLFGAFEDRSRPPASASQAAARLVVHGEAVFGGIVVRNRTP